MRASLSAGLIAGLVGAGVLIGASAPASAQASGCENMQKLLTERQSIVAKLNAASQAKRKMTPVEACSVLGRLVGNGNSAIKFAEANKDWCQIPDAFLESMKVDNQKAGGIRNQACGAAKQQASLQRRAEQQAKQQAGGNPFGGADAVTGGPVPVPRAPL